MAELEEFAAAVGDRDPVAVVGGRTHWDVGGTPDPSARLVRAPEGVVDHRPEEMVVRVRAGSTVQELDRVLLRGGQMVPLDPPDPARATVGGVLAVGRAGLRRLRYGPVRDHVLEIRYVSAAGELVKAGAPVVKNVSGFDLVRLMVGSLGTLGLLAEVVLRTYPIPRAARWLSRPAPVVPGAELSGLHRPGSVLWDGSTVWVLLEGHPDDVESQHRGLGPDWVVADGPPPVPSAGRLSLDPGGVAGWAADRAPGSFLAQIGVGVIHLSQPGDPVRPAGTGAGAGIEQLNRRIKERFDPGGRLNPGRAA